MASPSRRTPASIAALLVALGALGCVTPASAPDAGSARDAQLDAVATDAPPEDAPSTDAPVDAFQGDGELPPPCVTLADDYTPRISASSTDTWPECVTDTAATYPAFDPSISTSARVAAFDDMFAADFGGSPGELYGPDRDPTSAEFVMARMIYQTDNGLESRIARRPDSHVAEPTRPASCTDSYLCRCLDVAAASPAHCAGPALIQPIVLTALNQGLTGDTSEPSRVYAARAEAALTWGLYLSSYKESLSCAENTNDCDSAWSYYTGGRERDDGLGLARMVRAIEPETHERIWDGLLAVRCWRDLDPTIPPTRTDLQMRARAQQDRALLRGMVAILVDRLHAMESSSGDTQLAHLAFLRTLLAPIPEHTITDGTNVYTVAAQPSFFDRPLRAVDPAGADLVSAEIAEDPATMDVAEIVARLEAAYPCP